MENSKPDAFGFKFWLFWILSFAGTFLASAIFWTLLMTKSFGRLAEPELVLTWAVSVFGSWFLLLIPFMRKKEQIWKRLNQDEEKAVDAALKGMGVFLGLFVAAAFGWSFFFYPRIMESAGRFDGLWLKAVFGSWLALMLPFLVLLYKKADLIFKAAVARQNAAGPKFRTAFVERSKRLLRRDFVEKLKKSPQTLDKGQIVEVTLTDGRKIPNVFVLNRSEILGLYDYPEFCFDTSQIQNVELMTDLPVYEENRWLRLDGRA